MTEVYMVIDESGAKGYSDKQEKEPGEFGLAAGLLIPGDSLNVLRHYLIDLVSKYDFKNVKKIHMAELPQNIKARLREDLFDIIIRGKIPCFYYAEKVQQLHNFHNDVHSSVLDIMRRNLKTDFYTGPNNRRKELLHSKLLAYVIESGLYYCINEWDVEKPFKLNVIIDKIDNKTKEKVEKEVQKVLFAYDDSEFSITIDDSEFVLLSDALSHSIYQHLIEKQKENSLLDLNSEEAIIGHHLAEYLHAYF